VKKFTLLFAALSLALLAVTTQLSAATGETLVTGAADGAFSSAATFSGVTLNGSTFGVGVAIYADGTAEGDFQTVLAGVTALGTAQSISVEGKVKAGSQTATGGVSFSGDATVDMGDGSLPATGVPFTVTMTTSGLQLVIGVTTLVPQNLTAGEISIQ
jgi:hypothetical protein